MTMIKKMFKYFDHIDRNVWGCSMLSMNLQ